MGYSGAPTGAPDVFGSPDYPQVAGAVPGPHPALLAADTERREGLDRAGGAGTPLRGAPRVVREERPDVARVPRVEPEQQDPRDHRSRRARWPPARALRVGRHPLVPRREDRAPAAGGSRRAIRDPAVAHVP